MVQLYWEWTDKYSPCRAGSIFPSTLPVELGVYWKIWRQLPEQYGESNHPILIDQEEQYWNCNWECLYCDSSGDVRWKIAWTLTKSLGLRPRDFLWAQAIFYRKSFLSSQYRHGVRHCERLSYWLKGNWPHTFFVVVEAQCVKSKVIEW